MVPLDGARPFGLAVIPSYDAKTAFVPVARIGGEYLVFRELYQIFR